MTDPALDHVASWLEQPKQAQQTQQVADEQARAFYEAFHATMTKAMPSESARKMANDRYNSVFARFVMPGRSGTVPTRPCGGTAYYSPQRRG